MFPENTLPAFEYAICVGADFVELDVAVTLDDVVVVSHDPKLNRLICRSPGGPKVIRELTLAELTTWDCGARRNPRFPRQTPVPGARIPTLDQVLALANVHNVRFNIEVKSFPEHPELTPQPARFAELVCQAIEGRGLEDRVMVQSFDFRILRAVRRIVPQVRLAALYAGRPTDFISIAREAEADVIAPHHALAARKKVYAAHSAGLQVVPWTANTQRTWRRLIDAHADGIITDDPAGLLKYLREKGLHQ